MAIPRKEALSRLLDKVFQIERHLGMIAAEPECRAASGWKREVRNWLREMEALLRHVGKKTSAEWQTRIAAYRAALED